MEEQKTPSPTPTGNAPINNTNSTQPMTPNLTTPVSTPNPVATPIQTPTPTAMPTQPTPIATIIEQNTIKTENTPTTEPKTVNLDNYVYQGDDSQTNKTTNDDKNNKKDEKFGNYGAIVAIIVVIIAIFYFSKTAGHNSDDTNVSNNQENVSITVNPNKENGEVKVVSENNKDGITNTDTNNSTETSVTTTITAFYANTKNNPNMADCSAVSPLKRDIPKKYDDNIINTVRGLLTSLSAEEKSAGWVSTIPSGTYLQSVKIKDGGVAEINFNNSLSKVSGSCAVTSIHAQIETTLKQFSSIKSVIICINGNCNQDEILQP
ncbi:MAG: GerMN domain-containing protein [bacterium]